eukprot:2500067-Rhodomonas_salina.2
MPEALVRVTSPSILDLTTASPRPSILLPLSLSTLDPTSPTPLNPQSYHHPPSRPSTLPPFPFSTLDHTSTSSLDR